MMKSMTAFGRSKKNIGGKDITAEIRSVNNRYFDCAVHLPRAYGYLEEKIKPFLQSKGISRGKVDVNIYVEIKESKNVEIHVDSAYAEVYIDALMELKKKFRLKDDISVMNVARNPEIFRTGTVTEPDEQDWVDISLVLSEAVDMFLSGREREGANIEADLCEKIEKIRAITEKIEAKSALDVTSYGQRLKERITQMLSDNKITIDESRILTECAIFADRVAIDEELVRLRSHFDAFRAICDAPEPAGRKLDFLIQEMNRETNTIGSKCSDSDIAHLVVDVKTELEKIREQIQNIE